MLVRRFLHANGFRCKLHDKSLPGKPDIVLPKYKTVIFVHGCFWHGHEGCKYYVVPKTRTEWWLNKINGNIANDVPHLVTLAIFVKHENNCEKCFEKILGKAPRCRATFKSLA
jgi:DNA mismatch endonuclease (patch repair protein)